MTYFEAAKNSSKIGQLAHEFSFLVHITEQPELCPGEDESDKLEKITGDSASPLEQKAVD